ncbi:MAG: MYXO-CTERM sorting domain-containing protein [Minicystis sp.]
MKRALALSAVFAAITLGHTAAAYCPSYSPDSSFNTHDCGVPAQPGKNPSTAEWQPIFDLVSQGPAAWGDAGPSVTDIGQGCGKPEPLHSVPARFPCELLKAIAMIESGWRQFCVPDTPDDQVGGASRTIISFDCGYGVGQVTSGMHTGESPGFDRDRVAGDPTYNLATGTRILASKWKATECVGDNQPAIIEDWYSATWAYNGLAYVNNPNNPNYDPNRGVWDPAVGGAAPYQEKVFGRIEHTGGKWDPTSVAYPNPGDIGTSGSPNELPEPDCASPTDCGNHRSVHTTVCNGSTGTGGSGGGGTGGASTSVASSSSSTSGGHGSGGRANGITGSGEMGGEGGSGGTGGSNEEKGGCGCRVGGEGDVGAGAWVTVAVAIAMGGRRARRSGKRRGSMMGCAGKP